MNAVNVIGARFENVDINGLGLSYRIWPAISPNGIYEATGNGTEYFLMAEGPFFGLSNVVDVVGVTNTASLNTSTPHLYLTYDPQTVQPYDQAPNENQKTGGLHMGSRRALRCSRSTRIRTRSWQ